MGLGATDIVLLAISLLASAAIGIYHGIKGLDQTSTDYLLGGRMMKPLPLAMSLTAGTVSSITIMGNAGEMYAFGTQLWVMDVGMGLGMFFVARYFIPIFYPLKMISLYHYIESRFKSPWLRRATVSLTMGGGYLFIGFLLVPPSLFLTKFTGLDSTSNIVITGIVCSVYSSFGGVKAVVYTDVLQTVIMIAGSLAIVLQGISSVGGLDKVWDIAYHHGRIEFFNFDLDPFQRHSFWLVIINGFFFSLSTYGVNQSQTQRSFSTSSVKEAQRVIYYAIVGMFIIKGLMNLSGIVIFACYADCDPLTKDGMKLKEIFIVIHYVVDRLTAIPGLAGLFVASMYAAVLSSVSTQVNSMTALLWEDFLKALPIFKTWNEQNITRLQKVLVVVTGIIGIFASLLVSMLKSYLKNLLQLTGAVWGPMVGLFVVALYLPWVKLKGASLGFAVAILVSTWIVVGQIYFGTSHEFLPMSRSNCPPKVAPQIDVTYSNSSDIDQFNGTTSLMETPTDPTLAMINATEPPMESLMPTDESHRKRNRGVGFYGISDCLNYCWGAITCILVAILVTSLSSSNTPKDIDENLIHPAAWRWFKTGVKKSLMDSFRNCLSGCSSSRKDKEAEKGANDNEEEMEPMRNNHP